MNNFFINILARNVVVYAIAALVLAFSVRWPQVEEKRSLYLLGIFYNGFFQNRKDGIVYLDYMKRHHLAVPAPYNNQIPKDLLEQGSLGKD